MEVGTDCRMAAKERRVTTLSTAAIGNTDTVQEEGVVSTNSYFSFPLTELNCYEWDYCTM